MTGVKERIVQLLKKTVSRERDEDGNTLLHYVVETDNEEFIEYLIAAGCDVNTKNDFGIPPLICAVRNNSVKATKILLQAGATHDNSYFQGSHGPLHVAAGEGFYDIVQVLVEFGADVNSRDKERCTPLHEVTFRFNENRSSDYYNVLKALIDNGADLNVQCGFGFTPLYLCVKGSFEKGFELLLSRGADISAGDPVLHPLNATVYTSQLHLMKRLLELGADINVINDKGNSLLHTAFRKVDSKIVEFLLDKGLSHDQVNNDGFDPLTEGIICFMEIYSTSSGDDDDHDDTYICFGSALSDHIGLIDVAVKRGYNVNRVNNDGMTILYQVLQRYPCHSEVLRALLRHGATFDFDHPIVREVMDNSNGSKFPLLLLRQAALFEAQNRSDGPANFVVRKLNKQSQRDHYASCQAELELMKTTKIEDSNVSFFNILFQKDISGYMRNESIVSAFKVQDISKSFSIYHDLLNDRFFKELASQKLNREAAKGLSHVLQWDENALSVVLDTILTYFDEKDLITLGDI